MNKRANRILRNVLSSILVVLIFACAFITLCNLCFYFLYIETHVKGYSMQPTINMNVESSIAEGDAILINKYGKGEVDDIVVAEVEWFDSYIIKRLVGTPGDKIEIKDHDTHFSLYVNDNLLYSKEKTGENGSFVKTGSIGYYSSYISFLENPEFSDYIENDGSSTYIRLGENDYFLMGDNWGHTLDSIANGPVKKSEIVGRVDLIVDVTNNNPFTHFNFFMKKIFSFD